MKTTSHKVSENFQVHQQLLLMTEIAQKVSVVNVDGYYLGRNILFDFNLDYINNTLSNWDNIDKVDFDAKLRTIINQNRDWIIKYAIEALPSRKNIIESIFKLYDEKNYIALIPLVLTQIDGIAKDMTLGKTGFYNSKSDKLVFPVTNLYVFFVSNALQLHYGNRNDYELFRKNIANPQDFNRHAILHGESFQFGTERNAIKSILLFDFVREIYCANIN